MNDSDSAIPPFSRRLPALWNHSIAAGPFLAALGGAAFLDRLTGVLLLLSTFLFGIVYRYSRRYMLGDPGQTRFTFWLCLTGACVFALVLAGNLLLFAAFWCALSLSLHQLLEFYRERPGALLAARKKFLISRLGDAALATSLVLTHREFGSWNFQAIFTAARRLRMAGVENLPPSIHWLCGLLVFAALLKSAQFPFHSWLPDTMETPTPVSALMHAGIINAGGILVLRLSPLISLSHFASWMLVIAGGFTALFAATVMLTQASVKRCLAFSTVSQMGFMMLECGLGAFHLALLHLMMHSLYKAHAFLSSGSAVGAKPRGQQRSSGLFAIAAGLVAASVTGLATAKALGVSVLEQPVLSGVLLLALAQMLWNIAGQGERTERLAVGVVTCSLFGSLYFALDRGARLVLDLPAGELSWSALPVLAAFLMIAWVQARLPELSRGSLGRHLFVHARNGFYINTLANRITVALWPARVSREEV